MARGLLAPLRVDPGLQRRALLALGQVLLALEHQADHEQRSEQERRQVQRATPQRTPPLVARRQPEGAHEASLPPLSPNPASVSSALR
jgi:hypothetical protein